MEQAQVWAEEQEKAVVAVEMVAMQKDQMETASVQSVVKG
jgi:hypothetical protein